MSLTFDNITFTASTVQAQSQGGNEQGVESEPESAKPTIVPATASDTHKV